MQLITIQKKIYDLRGLKVMLDFDLAELYGVETRALKQAVKRNSSRFPHDFMFVLTRKEAEQMVSQNVIPSKSHFGGALPFAFTEQGVAMLSAVLNSKKAVKVNIAVMRAFVFLRQYALTHKDLTQKLKELEDKYDRQFKDIYEAINYLLKKDHQHKELSERKRIGYKR
jgi:regulator of PEP synthase PpsR (kinase-PPPase family)